MRTDALKVPLECPDSAPGRSFPHPKDGPMAGSMHISLRHLLTACTVILGLLLAAPVARADCEGQALEQPFAPWLDFAHYTLVGDGDLSGGAAGWELDGADLVADNEPWYVHGGDT